MSTADLLAEARRETTSQERLQELASLNDELAEAVADNIATPPNLLAKLATHNSKAVRKAVTSNPKAPKIVLFHLGVYFPQELLDNPIFDFSSLKDLSFIRKIPSGVLSILVQQNNVPRFLLNYAANHPVKNVSDTAKMHVDLSGEMTAGWHEAVSEIIREDAFVGHFINDFHGIIWDFKPGVTVHVDFETLRKGFEHLNAFYKFIPSDFLSILLRIYSLKRYKAQNPNTELIILKQLAVDEDRDVRQGVAANQNTPVAILRYLASDPDILVRQGVAANRNTPVEILKSFAKNPDFEMLWRLAENPSTPAAILDLSIGDRNNLILQTVARNPNTSTATLTMLADDSEDWFKEYAANNFNQYPETNSNYTKKDAISREYNRIAENVAKNHSTPIEVLKTLANEGGFWMRRYIAENPNASGEILKSFVDFEDEDNSVYSLVAKHPNTPREVLDSFIKIPEELWIHNYHNDGVLESVADNPNAPRDILELLAEDKSLRIRFRVARNPNTPVELLESLANDSDYQIREVVAENPHTPLKILESLANDSNLLVRESASKNPYCTPEIKKTIFKNFAKSETPSFSRVALFLSDYAASFVLAENSNSISWLERYAIAQNKNTLRDTLAILIQDKNRFVRATAKESLGKLCKKAQSQSLL